MALSDTAVLLEGQIQNANPADIITKSADEDITFGKVVSRGTGAALGTADVLGISVRSLMAAMDSDGEAFFPANGGQGVPILRRGYIGVVATEGATAGATAYVDADTGAFYASADTNTNATEVSGIVYEEDADAGDVVVVRINL